MVRDQWLLGMVYFEGIPETLVEDVVEAFRANGFVTHTPGRERIHLHADEPASSVHRVRRDEGRDLASVADRIHGRTASATPGGSVEVWHETATTGDESLPNSERTYTLRFHLADPVDDLAPVTIRGPQGWVLDHTDRGESDVLARVDAAVDAFAAVSERVDPWAACLTMMPEGTVPRDHPPDHGFDKLPFTFVFGEEWFDHLGGREHVLAAPVYETRSLDTGAVLVRTRDKPVAKRPRDDGPTGSPEKHLFEGLSAADRERFVDPFRDLDAGELASDPVMCEAHAPFECDGMDYAAFPELADTREHCHVLCVRREGDTLWAAHNGEFVRRLVDEDGTPIGDLPEGVPAHQEFVSTAIRTAYEDDPPMHMYRMDAVAEPSVFAKLYGMTEIPAGDSIWEDRETPVTR